MGNTRTESKPKPSPSDEIGVEITTADDLTELRPPKAVGFSGTAKLWTRQNAVLIDELIKRGYTRVTR